jgi:transposase
VIRLEGWMKVQELRQQGMSISEISRTLHLDRKTVRKQLTGIPRSYQGHERATKGKAYAVYLRERWEQGVHNAHKLFGEIQKRGVGA